MSAGCSALELCVLASGSSGNASVVRTPGGCVMVDAGVGPRVVGKRLGGTGVELRDIRAMVLTHLDSDHFTQGWVGTIVKMGVRVFAFTPYARKLVYLYPELGPLVVAFHATSFSPVEGVVFRPVPFAHDDTGSHGFVIEGAGCRVGYATDLGRVPGHMLEAFVSLDILAIEANYDPGMQMASARPWFLKQRIMGGAGHLSNQQALDAVKLILGKHEAMGVKLPGHIVLLHRSRQCNCPELLRGFFSKDARIAPRLTLAHQGERTGWLGRREREPVAGEQMALGFA